MCLRLQILQISIISIFLFYQTAHASVSHHDALKWQCDNGDQILYENRCDGVKDCIDGSDETVEHCIYTACPHYAFRCAYGACIAGTHKCNGKQDCVDNSDETHLLCKANEDERQEILQGNCSSSSSLQCSSGECTNLENLCDGIKNCKDGSDETVEACSHTFCPSYAFRCGYGGCIRGNSKCNSIADCADGSDEVPELCGKTPTVGKPDVVPPPVKPDTRPHEDGCLIPFNREHLFVSLSILNSNLLLGDRVPIGTTANFYCRSSWQLVGSIKSTCKANNTWSSPVPTCRKYCSYYTISRGLSTIATCYYNKNQVDCAEPLRMDTEAHVCCAPGYRPRRNATHTQILTCDRESEWNYPKSKCIPDCGVRVGGGEGKQPWSVAIYRRIDELDGKWYHKCSGAILSHKLVITASACFINRAEDLKPVNIDANLYQIVQGNYKKPFQSDEYIQATIYKIAEILYPEEIITERVEGIALIIPLNYFQFSMHLNAICWEAADYSKDYIRSEFKKKNRLDVGRVTMTKKENQHFLDEIVVARNNSGYVYYLNVNVYQQFIKRQLHRYRHLL